MKTGIELIAAERKRQIEVEGWTLGHDDHHDGQELALAAAAYALPRGHKNRLDHFGETGWEMESWKPEQSRIRELEKAGALIAAEIDRLLRAHGYDKS